jgi:hypothetical protein
LVVSPPAFPSLGSNASAALSGRKPLADVQVSSNFTTGSGTFVFDTTGLTGNVKLAFVSGGVTNSKLTAVTVQVSAGGAAIFDQTFTDWTVLAAALTDQVHDLGSAAALNGQPLIFSFQFAGTDGDTSGFSARMVVGAAESPLTQWALVRGLSGADALPGADFDRDGMNTLLEWALGTNPAQPGRQPITHSHSAAGLELTYTRSLAAAAAGAVCVVEWSDTLSETGWQTAGVTQAPLTTSGDLQTIRAEIPPSPAGRRFARVRVESPP